MDWTRPTDLRRQLERLWESGRILCAPLRGEPLFPFRLKLRGPEPRELSDEFDRVRAWIAEWTSADRFDLEWTEINHRLLGRNRLPSAALVVSEADALRAIGKEADAARFREMTSEAATRVPRLRDWLARKPLAALEHAAAWTAILDVLAWFCEHPRCGLYLRQLDLPGVDTKFIEERKQLFAELLDLTMPPETIDAATPAWKSFETRYGLRAKPNLVRFRVLDPQLAIHGLTDLSVPAHEFAGLSIPATRVFITENEINGVTFPDVPCGIAIFGLGYGLDRLADAPLLQESPLYYWGDIDTHGFAMLARVRALFPQTESLLMDRDTFEQCRRLCVRETTQWRGDLKGLTPEEEALFDDLRFNRLGDHVRLEQERIAFHCVERAIGALMVRPTVSNP
jgi:hypothetical protein